MTIIDLLLIVVAIAIVLLILALVWKIVKNLPPSTIAVIFLAIIVVAIWSSIASVIVNK